MNPRQTEPPKRPLESCVFARNDKNAPWESRAERLCEYRLIGRTAVDLPFEAYTGDAPYIFASYSHRDSALVYPELKRLHGLGYRIWYDEGIEPGSEWPDEIAKALEGCSQFLVFISPRAVASPYVRREIHFAIEEKKDFLAVHVEKTDLPRDLKWQMGPIQALMKYDMPADRYHRKMERALPSRLLDSKPAPAASAPARAVQPAPTPPPSTPSIVSIPSIVSTRPKPSTSSTDRRSYTEAAGGANLEMVWIPGGTGFLGDDASRKVRVKGFWIGKYEVTNGQYQRFLKDNRDYDGSREADSDYLKHFREQGDMPTGDVYPIVWVSWNNAKAFCDWLTRKAGKPYGLPTEAQWEFACRAGSRAAYCFGDSESQLGDYAWNAENSGRKAHEVGQKEPNAFGLYDMHGNVWEWCADWYDGSQRTRVLRGGGLGNGPEYCRAAFRSRFKPVSTRLSLGFRVARVVSPR